MIFSLGLIIFGSVINWAIFGIIVLIVNSYEKGVIISIICIIVEIIIFMIGISYFYIGFKHGMKELKDLKTKESLETSISDGSCNRCNGTGKCKECKGKGQIIGDDHFLMTCETCEGTGICPYCS